MATITLLPKAVEAIDLRDVRSSFRTCPVRLKSEYCFYETWRVACSQTSITSNLLEICEVLYTSLRLINYRTRSVDFCTIYPNVDFSKCLYTPSRTVRTRRPARINVRVVRTGVNGRAKTYRIYMPLTFDKLVAH